MFYILWELFDLLANQRQKKIAKMCVILGYKMANNENFKNLSGKKLYNATKSALQVAFENKMEKNDGNKQKLKIQYRLTSASFL